MNLLEVEKANIRRTIGEMIFLVGTWIMISALTKAMDDDDEDDWYLSFLAYQAARFKSELLFFVNPIEAMRILRSPMASMSVVENTANILSQLLSDPGELYQRGHWKGKPKIVKDFINFIPVQRQVYRLMYIDDQISWFHRK